MVSDITKLFLEVLKLAPRYLISLGVIAAIFLFSSDTFLKRLGVFDFTQNNRPWIGITLIVSAALFGVSVSADLLTWVLRWWRQRKAFQSITKRLHCLTEDEKQILRYYIAKNSRANTLRIDDGIVQGLVHTGIIYRSASLGTIDGFAHNITPIAWDYLQVHPEILDGSTNTYRTDKCYW